MSPSGDPSTASGHSEVSGGWLPKTLTLTLPCHRPTLAVSSVRIYSRGTFMIRTPLAARGTKQKLNGAALLRAVRR
jgi:hypothetical protein